MLLESIKVNSNSRRNSYFEMIRGISIIAVIIIHSLSPSNVCQEYYAVIIRSCVNFAVATFVFLSGFFVNTAKVEENPMKYIKSRFLKLGIPYVFWSIVYEVLHGIMWEKINILAIIKRFILGQTAAQMYYIVMLLQLIIITPVLVKLAKKKTGKVLALMITVMYLIIVLTYHYIYKRSMPLYSVIFFGWFVYYYLGIYIRINGSDRIKSISKNIKICFTVIALLVVIILNTIVLKSIFEYEYRASQVTLLNLAYSMLIISIIISCADIVIKPSNFLVKIGNNSFGIYLIHLLPIQILKSIFDLHQIQLPIIINEIVYVSTALLVSSLIIFIIRKAKLSILIGENNFTILAK